MKNCRAGRQVSFLIGVTRHHQRFLVDEAPSWGSGGCCTCWTTSCAIALPSCLLKMKASYRPSYQNPRASRLPAAKAGAATSAQRQSFPRAASQRVGIDPHRKNAAVDGGGPPPGDVNLAPAASMSKTDARVDNRGSSAGKGTGKSVRFSSSTGSTKHDKENDRNDPPPPPPSGSSSAKKVANKSQYTPAPLELTEQRSASKQRLEALTLAVERAAPATPCVSTAAATTAATPLRHTPSRALLASVASSSAASRTPISLLNSELDLVEKRTGSSCGGPVDDSLLVSPEPSQARQALHRRFAPSSEGKSLIVATRNHLPPRQKPDKEAPKHGTDESIRQGVRGKVALRIDTSAPPLEGGETMASSDVALKGGKMPLPSVHGPCDHKEMAIQWNHEVIHAVASPADGSTPSGGLCLDLSGMFCNVASDFKRPPKPQLSLPPSRAKPWKRPAMQVSSTTTGTASAASTRAPLPPPHPHKPAAVEMAATVVDHTNSHAASVQNEEWSEKLCEIFTQWLNLMLQPTILDADSYAMDNPSAMRTLRAHQQMTSTRLRALQLFNDQPMRRAREALQNEIRSGKLSLRRIRTCPPTCCFGTS
jgi:hypothetical protein